MLSLVLSLFVGMAAFAQTADQDHEKKKDKDKYEHKADKSTSQYQDAQGQQDFTAYDTDQDGKLNEEEFKTVYVEVEESATAETGVEDRDMSADREQDQEFISSRFEAIDEDSDGYVDEEEFNTWINDTGAK